MVQVDSVSALGEHDSSAIYDAIDAALAQLKEKQ